ncbi:MAG: pyruvate, phosphate dikinase [Deltaproteobacteria bacterium]|nr:pyruvate, phosphate dikinase [Deltaproteobacteria bacterium]
MDKLVYAFGGGSAEGRGDQKQLLGGKGSGLAEMAALGLPVPPGFTITTEVCRYYHANGHTYPPGLQEQIDRALADLERKMERRFGDLERPLLVSVRSGAPTSMPGMMDTVLNIGLNDAIAAAEERRGVEPRFVRDCHRRLLSMYGDVVLEVPKAELEALLTEARRSQGVATDAELSAESLAHVVEGSKALLKKHGKPMPSDPKAQLEGAIRAVFESWHNARAIAYRKIHGLSDVVGTAVNVQAMVFGNRGPDCASGVAFTRDPASGEKRLFGEYLVNAQGEDVVAGIRTPRSVLPKDASPGMADEMPGAFETLVAACKTLEQHRRDMQDVEFTVEGGKLYMLQTRNGKRAGLASLRIAVDMVDEGLIDAREALARVEPAHLAQLLSPVVDAAQKSDLVKHGGLVAKGLPAGPGVAAGRIALDAARAVEMAKDGAVLLVREETSPEDVVGMFASAGILTSRGGMTSHAAVVARGMGKPCVVGASALIVDEHARELRVGGRVLKEGDWLSIDGTTGEVLVGALAPHPSEVVQALVEADQAARTRTVECFERILAWSDERTRMQVWANADTPTDAKVARRFGARGIGLCRTEHMFFADDRIPWVRRMILASDAEERKAALAALLPMQQSDFEGILEAMHGLPVTIRLLDPPLHEFLPHEEHAVDVIAKQTGATPAAVRAKAAALAELNPMLGHRGCRLGLSAPDIYAMQIEAVGRATARLRRRRVDARPEIMMPLVGTHAEMVALRKQATEVLARVAAEEGIELDLPIGTMIEVPRAALVADRIAGVADFFSFGTNDLTQMTFGFSRDDVGTFLPHYLETNLLRDDPFASIDTEGVGQLVKLAAERGRSARPKLKLGVCGEHGGDPRSIVFFETVPLDYVSCSPYRVPIARLAAARAALGLGAGGGDA